METIGNQKLFAALDQDGKAKRRACSAVRKESAELVASYTKLAGRVAELQYVNRDFVLVFRGQPRDYRNQSGYTSLKPTILRGSDSKNVSTKVLSQRYKILNIAETSLLEHYHEYGHERLRRQRILRWSLLQHYRICETPLLDVTQSLRIAASFASDDDMSDGYVFVLGVPNLSGAVTTSAEWGIQIIRLASACPPSAVRPHIQEGYLLGEYPEMSGVEQKKYYKDNELDFGLRLVAKFRFRRSSFWRSSPDFLQVPHEALYPKHDPLLKLVEKIKNEINGGS